MNEKSFICNPLKLCISLTTAIVSLVLGVALLTVSRFFSALFFFAIMLVFSYIACMYGSAIIINDEGVKRSILRRVVADYTWNEIGEVGVIGANPFSNRNDSRFLNIYISKKVLTEQERFDLMVSWPPKDAIFLSYNKQRLEAIQLHYSSKIHVHNAGNLVF